MSTTKRCYYETLEVERNADDSTLKSAFRKLAMKWHPDRNPGDPQCEIKFKEINEAYEVLKDGDKRAAYDRYGHAAFEQGGFGGGAGFGAGFASSFSDIFEDEVIASATIVREAIWLEEHGVDAVIVQGAEAGGHRGMFMTDDIAQQPGLFALLPQVVDAVRVPVIAAGGIADGRGIAAAFALGAAGVQIGTAYLRCPESRTSALVRAQLAQGTDEATVITNVMTGRPARGVANRLMREVGPVSPDAPAFPHAASALGPLKAAAEKQGQTDFTNLWAGQAVRLGRDMPAAELTRALAGAALARLSQLAG
jgi:NAD(P)H-dependent flavin oxidoreductase YrpB (nitropropane dioxygenase family)